jgi:hypothetical protein
MKMEFSVVDCVTTPDEPDVLLFSPIDPSLLLVGTYHLGDTGQRTGTLLLYSVDAQTSKWYSLLYMLPAVFIF